MTTGGRGLSVSAASSTDVGRQIDVAVGHAHDVVAEFGDQQFGGVLVDRLGQRDRRAHLEQRLDQVGALFGHAVGEFLDGDRFGHDDVADLLGLRLARAAHAAMFLFARPLERGERAGARAVFAAERAVDGQLAAAAFVAGAAALAGTAGLLRGLGAATRRRLAGAGRGRARGGSGRRLPSGSGRRLGLGLRLGNFGTRDRREAARRRHRRVELERDDRLGRRAPAQARASALAAGSGAGSWRRGGLPAPAARGALLGAALFFLGGGVALGILAAARILERAHALLFGFAQQLRLALLRRQLRRGGRARRLGRAGFDRGAGRRRVGDRRFGGRGVRAEHAAALDLDHDGVRAPVAEALLHLAGLDRALQPQRLAHAEFRLFVVGVAHSKSSSSAAVLDRRGKRRCALRGRFARLGCQIRADKMPPAIQRVPYADRGSGVGHGDMYHIFAAKRQGQYGARDGKRQAPFARALAIAPDAPRLGELAGAVGARRRLAWSSRWTWPDAQRGVDLRGAGQDAARFRFEPEPVEELALQLLGDHRRQIGGDRRARRS